MASDSPVNRSDRKPGQRGTGPRADHLAGRIDLPTNPAAGKEHDVGRYEVEARESAATLAATVVRQNPTSVLLVGYGTSTRVTPVLTVATGVFHRGACAGGPGPAGRRRTTLAPNRALEADPGYQIAQLLYQIVQAGPPPSALDGPTA